MRINPDAMNYLQFLVLEDSGVSDVLELNTYLTSLKGPSEADGDAEYGRDPITGLRVEVSTSLSRY